MKGREKVKGQSKPKKPEPRDGGPRPFFYLYPFGFNLILLVFRLEFVDQFGQVVAGFDVFGDFFDGEPNDF